MPKDRSNSASSQQNYSKPGPRKSSAGSFDLSFRRVARILLITLVLVSSFVLVLQTVPNKGPSSAADQERFLALAPVGNEKRVVIPKISVNAKIYEGDSKVLDQGVWHRFPERGNPEIGGNFILAAHRYIFSFIPQKVTEKSVFYNIDKLNIDDKIYVDWQNKRYQYIVTEKFKVKPSDTQIESKSEKAKLTLYSCTREGQADGREVVIANLSD